MPKTRKEELSDIFEAVSQEQRRSASHSLANKTAEGQEMAQLNLTVPAEFRQRLKVYAAQHRMTLVNLVVQACEKWIEDEGSPQEG